MILTVKPNPMYPTDWISDCRLCINEAREITNELTEEQFNWKPAPGKWSVAECFEHLNLTGGKMMPHIDRAIERGYRRGIKGEPPFQPGYIGRWFLKGSGPRGKPIPAPRVFRPASSGLSKKLVLDEFLTLQEQYISLVEKSDGLDLTRLKARSAITPLFRLNLATWFQSMPAHQQRHFAQMRRVMEATDFPE